MCRMINVKIVYDPEIKGARNDEFATHKKQFQNRSWLRNKLFSVYGATEKRKNVFIIRRKSIKLFLRGAG